MSLAPDGVTPGDQMTYNFTGVSDDGRYVGFSSAAHNLVATGNPNLCAPDICSRIFRRDMKTGTTERADVLTGGADPSGGGTAGQWAAFSSNGRFVAFASEQALDVASYVPGWRQVYVRDAAYGVTRLVSTWTDGGPFPCNPGAVESVSDDGTRVAFAAPRLTDDGTCGEYQVWASDTAPWPALPPAPGVTGTPSPAPAATLDGQDWWRGPVTITWTATASGTPPRSPAPSSVTAEGATVVTSDEVCNISCGTGSYTVRIDSVKPVVTIGGVADGGSYVAGVVSDPTS